MSNLSSQAESTTLIHAESTAGFRNYHEGPSEVHGDVRLHQRYFTYKTASGWVAGKTFNVMLSLDRPAKDVWPLVKDFNLWQNCDHHYYSGVLGDLEGESVRLTLGSDLNDPNRLFGDYQVVKVIPQNLIAVSQLVAQDGPLAGVAGYTVLMLNEHENQTVITVLIEHHRPSPGLTEDETLIPWRKMATDSQRKWRDAFIPTLKKLIQGDH